MFSGSLVAVVTPMVASGDVDYACLDRLVDFHVEQGTDGLVVAGTTGESATLEKREHIEVIHAVARKAAGRIPVIAGTGSNATRQTVELSRAVDELPIDAFLLVTPYYNKPTQEGLYQHFANVADAVSHPVMLYNVPGRTAVDLKPETVARLATHPRIFGIKEATGDMGRLDDLRESCPEEFRLFSGDDATAREFMNRGGHGVVTVTGNVAPKAMHDMSMAAVGGEAPGAAEIDERLAGLHQALFLESNPIPVKWALQRMGLIGPGIRLPLTPLSAAYQAAVEDALNRAGLL